MTVTAVARHRAGLVARRQVRSRITSYRTGFQDIIVSYIYERTGYTNPTNGTSEKQNFLPAWSPDGTRLAFTSNRDGNAEIYVINRDGSGLRRLTNHPEIDVTPTWSPTGNQIAFTSEPHRHAADLRS